MTNIIELNPSLTRALKEKEDYLASLEGTERDRALKLQSKIDEALLKAGNQNNRMTIIQKMMLESFFELNDKFAIFYQDLIDLQKSIDELKQTSKDNIK